MASNYNPLGSGPPGFVPDPQAHAPKHKQDPPNKGKIKDIPDKTEHNKPLNDRFQAFMQDKWQDLRTAYVIFHMIVWQNLLFYVNELWIQWDKDRRIYQPAVPEDDYTPQPKINYFAPAADAVTSVFTIPEVECIPKTGHVSNDDAHDAAEVANALISEFKNRNGIYNSKDGKPTVGDKASQMFVLQGNIFGWTTKEEADLFYKPEYDQIPMVGVRCPQCDTLQKVPPDDPMLNPPPAPSDMLIGQQVQPPVPPSCPTCANPLQTYPTSQSQPKMDPTTGEQVHTPIQRWTANFRLGNSLYALPRASSRGMDDARWIFWAERMSIDEIYEKWDFEASPDNEFLDSMESSWEIALNYYYTGYSNLTQGIKDSCLVYWAFVEPGKVKNIPEGGVGVIVNNQLIKLYQWEEFCPCGHALTFGQYLNMPVTFFGRTPMFDVAECQRELNRYEAVIALNAMTQAADSTVCDENTKVSEITGRGDRIIWYRSIGPTSQPPHKMQHGSLDNGVYEQRQKLQDQIQNITGAVNVWRGQQAGSVTAASAISQLRGQAEQGFSKPLQNWNNFWTESIRKGVLILQLVLQDWEIMEIMGTGNATKIAKFKKCNLDSICDFISGMKGLPRTRDERRNDMLALFDRKFLDVNDPNVQEEINDLFGETGMKVMFTRDATRARAENAKMRRGEQVQFMPEVENLEIHLFIHSEEIKGLDFDTYPQPIQQMMLEHFLQTKQALSAMMQAAQAQAGAKPGEGPNPKPPGQPQGGAPGGGPHEQGGPPKLKKQAPPSPGPTNMIAAPTGPAPGGVQ